MNSLIRERIRSTREALAADLEGPIAGKIPEGRRVAVADPQVAPFFELLAETNGPRCGGIDFWSAEEFARKQFFCESLPGGITSWSCVGQLLYEPLMLLKKTGEVFLFRSDPPPDLEGQCLGHFDNFLADVAFGPGYSSLIPNAEEDRWYQTLRRLGFLK